MFTTYRTVKEAKGREQKVGAPLHPRNVLRTLHQLLDKANLPVMQFHDLRHSAASLLLAAGVELAEVSMLLGHSELRVTMDFYAHLQKQTAGRRRPGTWTHYWGLGVRRSRAYGWGESASSSESFALRTLACRIAMSSYICRRAASGVLVRSCAWFVVWTMSL